ncbi:MAG: hypothetical protein U0271_15650 [Polyangiaceae bacterium]
MIEEARKGGAHPDAAAGPPDAARLMEQLEPHLAWLAESQRPRLTDLIERGDHRAVLVMLNEAHAHYPRNVSITRAVQVVERAAIQRLNADLEPIDRIVRRTAKPLRPRESAPLRRMLELVDGERTIEELLRDCGLKRLESLEALKDLLNRDLVFTESEDEPPIPHRDASVEDLPQARSLERTPTPRATVAKLALVEIRSEGKPDTREERLDEGAREAAKERRERARADKKFTLDLAREESTDPGLADKLNVARLARDFAAQKKTSPPPPAPPSMAMDDEEPDESENARATLADIDATLAQAAMMRRPSDDAQKAARAPTPARPERLPKAPTPVKTALGLEPLELDRPIEPEPTAGPESGVGRGRIIEVEASTEPDEDEEPPRSRPSALDELPAVFALLEEASKPRSDAPPDEQGRADDEDSSDAPEDDPDGGDPDGGDRLSPNETRGEPPAPESAASDEARAPEPARVEAPTDDTGKAAKGADSEPRKEPSSKSAKSTGDGLRTASVRPIADAPRSLPPPPEPLPEPKRRQNWTRITIAALSGLLAALLVVAFAQSRNTSPPAPGSATASASTKASAPQPSTRAVPASAPAATSAAPVTTVATSASASSSAEAATVMIKFDVSPDYARVTVDGKRLPKKPLELTLPRDGSKHKALFTAPGFNPKELTFTADSDVKLVVALDAVVPSNPPPPTTAPTTAPSTPYD